MLHRVSLMFHFALRRSMLHALAWEAYNTHLKCIFCRSNPEAQSTVFQRIPLRKSLSFFSGPNIVNAELSLHVLIESLPNASHTALISLPTPMLPAGLKLLDQRTV